MLAAAAARATGGQLAVAGATEAVQTVLTTAEPCPGTCTGLHSRLTSV